MIEVAVTTALLGVLMAGTISVVADARSRGIKASQRSTAVAHAQSGLNALLHSPVDWAQEWGNQFSIEEPVYIGNSNFPRILSVKDNEVLKEQYAFSGLEYKKASFPQLKSEESIREAWVAVKHLTWSGKDVNSVDYADGHINWVYTRGVRRLRTE